jgi:hypothetical protein
MRFRPLHGRLASLYLSLAVDSVLLEGVQRYARLGYSFDLPQGELALGQMPADRGETPRARERSRGAGLRADDAGPPGSGA